MYQAVTRNITVSVNPKFMPDRSSAEKNYFFWSYTVEITNRSAETVQLKTRHWRITDGRGAVNFVEGEGVVGEQPVLQPGQTHDYVSGCPLSTPTGSMEGYYTLQRDDGQTIEAAIPFFPLAAPATAG